MSVFNKSISWHRAVYVILKRSLEIDFSSKEKIITPVFFATIILIMFSFAFPEQDPSLNSMVLIAQSQLSVFFGLQIAFSRAFDSERIDRLFDYIRMMPIVPSAFLVAKMLHVFLTSILTMAMTTVLAVILQGRDLSLAFNPTFTAINVATVTGLVGLGVLLASITLKAEAQQILFPILYFPLSVPVFLASTEAQRIWTADHVWNPTINGWMVILLAFDAMYLSLAFLLGSESMELR